MDSRLEALAKLGFDAERAREPLPPAPTPAPRGVIVSGVAARLDGLCQWRVTTGEQLPDGTLRASQRVIHRNDPPSDYAPTQPARLPVLIDHDPRQEIGEVLHLEIRHGQMYVVGRLALDPEDLQEGLELCWSPATTTTRPPFTITEMSLTRSPATFGLSPVRFWPASDLESAVAYPGNRELLRGAMDAVKRRRAGDPISIHDFDAPHIGDKDAVVLMERSTAAVAHISATQRVIEVVAVPYGVETRVYWRGEWWLETFAPGAFRDFIRTGKLPRVNREHVKGATIGKIIKLRESAEGLIAEVQVARTALGDETLLLAADDMISASIGFGRRRPCRGPRSADDSRPPRTPRPSESGRSSSLPGRQGPSSSPTMKHEPARVAFDPAAATRECRRDPGSERCPARLGVRAAVRRAAGSPH
jgi:hypothetical protein